MGNKMTWSTSGAICWSAPSNIALVKYWGKRPIQLPGNASLSLTLEKSRTTIEASWQPAPIAKLNFSFAGQAMPSFAVKVEKWLANLAESYPALNQLELSISSRNTFPHSAGIASSASSMAAMALVVSDILNLNQQSPQQWLQTTSKLARLGSGSAARSLFPHAATWGHESDEWGSGVTQMHSMYRDFGDAILIVDSAKKAVSSSEGHELMNRHPYKELRFQTADKRVDQLLEIMQRDDFEAFAQLVEQEALELHALMMTSNPSFILMRPNTLELIARVREQRRQGSELCFTLDAGPNLHLLYPARARAQAEQFVAEAVRDNLLEDGQWIDDHVGNGPKKEV